MNGIDLDRGADFILPEFGARFAGILGASRILNWFANRFKRDRKKAGELYGSRLTLGFRWRISAPRCGKI